MIIDPNSSRPEIEYPCEWGYKVIGTNVDEILFAIKEASLGLDYDVTPSNMSTSGKYCSLNFSLTVPSEVVRDLIYEKLKKNSAVKIIL
jgi:uncharacterized protein